MRLKTAFTFFSFLVLLFSLNQAQAKEVSVQTKLSYVSLDLNGSRNSLPELYNVYSGFSLEKLNLATRFKTNSTFRLNLRNINLDNRDFNLNSNLPDVLNLKASHNKSRFVFDREGDIKSFRTRTNMGMIFKPMRFLKFNVDYSHQSKEGDRLGYVEENPGVLGGKYDQMIHNGNVGVQLKLGKRYLTFSHRILLFDSDLNDGLDRKSNRTEISLNTPLPAKISVSLRYAREESKLEKKDLKLNTDFFAGTISQRVSKRILAAFKFSFQRSDNFSTSKMTDIVRAGPWLSCQFSDKFETALGYEYQNNEDQYSKINTHSILLGAKARPMEQLLISGLYRFKTRKDPDFSTLTGEYDEHNKLLKLRYKPVDKINIQMRYQDKIRKNKDINTKAETQGFYSNLDFAWGQDFDLTFYLNLLDWDFHNFQTDYQTSNRTYGLTINLEPIQSFKLKGGASYLELSKDLDINKYSFSIGLSCELVEGFAVEADFERFKYEDMITCENDFDAIVFKIGVLRTFNKF